MRTAWFEVLRRGTDRIEWESQVESYPVIGAKFIRETRRLPRPQAAWTVVSEGRIVLSEAEVRRSFQKLFQRGQKIEPDVFEKAESLLDELRPESPLRHRLQGEIEELRKIHSPKKTR